MLRAIILVVLLVQLQDSTINRVDSTRRGDSVWTKRVEILTNKPAEFPALRDRFVDLIVGVVMVGGLALLINERRRRKDRRQRADH